MRYPLRMIYIQIRVALVTGALRASLSTEMNGKPEGHKDHGHDKVGEDGVKWDEPGKRPVDTITFLIAQ
jgi:hypothetical protein